MKRWIAILNYADCSWQLMERTRRVTHEITRMNLTHRDFFGFMSGNLEAREIQLSLSRYCLSTDSNNNRRCIDILENPILPRKNELHVWMYVVRKSDAYFNRSILPSTAICIHNNFLERMPWNHPHEPQCYLRQFVSIHKWLNTVCFVAFLAICTNVHLSNGAQKWFIRWQPFVNQSANPVLILPCKFQCLLLMRSH